LSGRFGNVDSDPVSGYANNRESARGSARHSKSGEVWRRSVWFRERSSGQGANTRAVFYGVPLAFGPPLRKCSNFSSLQSFEGEARPCQWVSQI
jgi:hypothetical protein